ncbi:MAG: gluconokinase [Anaerolineales bacterium]
MARAIIVMGVSGSGKSTVGKALAVALGWSFYDGDDFMPAVNVEKMGSGKPLTDADRFPWLDILQSLIVEKLAQDESLVLACSSLKEIYRQRLRAGNPDTLFVHLKGDYDLIKSRLEARPDHFMKAGMLQSQFETLEQPKTAIVVDVTGSVNEIVENILTGLS